MTKGYYTADKSTEWYSLLYLVCRPSTQQVSLPFKTYPKERIKSLNKEFVQWFSLCQAYHGQKLK